MIYIIANNYKEACEFAHVSRLSTEVWKFCFTYENILHASSEDLIWKVGDPTFKISYAKIVEYAKMHNISIVSKAFPTKAIQEEAIKLRKVTLQNAA